MLIAALVVTLVVLLIDASIKSRSPSVGQSLSAQAWVDQALPLIRDSTAQGQQLYNVRTDGLSMSGSVIASQVNHTAAAAAGTFHAATKLTPPPALATANGLFDACLLIREQAAASMAKALVSTLTGPSSPPPSVSAALSQAGQKLQSADQLYRLFTKDLPGVGVRMPPSVWDQNASLYQTPVLTDYLTALRSKTNLKAVHDLAIQSISTNPLPERLQGSVQVIPKVSSITVSVTVADLGNQTERNLTLSASTYPAVRAPVAQVQLGTLRPGAARAVTLGPLYPVAGTPVTLTVKVNGPASSATPTVTRTLTLEMPTAKVPLATTTTTAPATTTTVPTSPTTATSPSGSSTTSTPPTT